MTTYLEITRMKKVKKGGGSERDGGEGGVFYLSVVDVVMRRKRSGCQIARYDDRLARIEHMMTGLDQNVGPSDHIVLGGVASTSVAAASARRIVRKVHVARLRYKDTLFIK